MKLTIHKSDLVHLLASCQGAVDRKSTLPVLANVLLTAGDGELRCSATNLAISIESTAEASIDEPGAIALPARDTLERVRAMPDGDVVLEVRDCQATIRAAGTPRRFTISGLPADEFPSIPTPEDGATVITVSTSVLTRLIEQTRFSVCTDETRVHLNSALFRIDGAQIRMVSTDGHRLSVADRIDPEASGSVEMLVPLRAVTELQRAIAGEERTVELVRSGGLLFVNDNSTMLALKLVDAEFPPYQQVIPEKSSVSVTTSRAALLDAVRSVALAANGTTGGIAILLTKKAIRVSAASPESGEALDEVPLSEPVKLPEDNQPIGVNAGYLIDALGAVDGENVTLQMSGDLDPIVIRPSGVSSGSAYLAVVMPMRV